MHAIRKTVRNHQNSNIYRYFLDFSRGDYGEEFRDTTDPDDYITLSFGCL